MNVVGKRTLGSSRDADDGKKTTIALHSIADLTAGEQVSLILNTIHNTYGIYLCMYFSNFSLRRM